MKTFVGSPMSVRHFSVVSLLVSVACIAPDQNFGGDEDPMKDTSGLEEIPVDSGDSGTGEGDGTITGAVQVELYSYDDAGELVWEEWEPLYGDDFPFGSIFVAAYRLDEEAMSMSYLDQYVIRSPDPDGNTYELQVDPAEAEQVRVYALLDYWADGILASNEPMGIWPEVIDVESGLEVDDVDIDIPAPYYDFGTGGGGGGPPGGVGGGGGGGDWDPADYVTITGDGLITEPYAGGSAMALLYDSAGDGPYYADAFTPTKTDEGAEGEYEIWVPKNWGSGILLGAWDSNFNGLIDPADEWGSYVDETGVSLNPVPVLEEDITDATLMIPDGLSSNPSAVPFVVLAGQVAIQGGFDAVSSGTVYVMASKYKPDIDLSASDIPAIAYDYTVWTGADLTGDALDFTLIAPADTLVYLWAYLDADNDGIVNEPGEAVASYGSDPSGRLTTGDSSHTGLALGLRQVSE